MNWIYNLCSCITPQFKLSVIDYLNSKELNRQVIQQQKCSESNEPDNNDPTDHVYHLAKSRSINFMKLEDNSDDEDDEKGSHHNHESENEETIDAFWYKKMKKGQNKMEHYRFMFTHKFRVFGIMLEQDPTSKGYDKIYDSQDEINLKVYCKLQSLVRGKKVNSYRFSFQISGISLDDYSKWLGDAKEKDILPLAEDSIILETDPEDSSFVISQRYYKKLLVISPHEFITAQKTFVSTNEQKSITTIIFSVEEQENKSAKSKQKEHSRGWLHLCGLEATQSQKGLHLDGYFCIELDVSVSPNMLKQPIAKQIRVVAQKIMCGLKKSDEI